MLGKEENWFQKNRGFILGFAVVVLVLNVVLALLLPSQKTVTFDGAVTEYAVQDESFSRAHTLRLEGVLTARAFHPTFFYGSMELDGTKWKLTGEHGSDGWQLEIAQTEGTLHLAEVQAERDWSTVVLLLAEDGERTCILFLSMPETAQPLYGAFRAINGQNAQIIDIRIVDFV